VEVSFSDIGDKRQAKTLSQGAKVIAQILQASLIPTFVIDHNHLVTLWNIACERLTGVTADQIIGTNKQWKAFYSVEKPVMADLIVDKAAKDILVKYFGETIQESTLVDGAYEAEGFFPDLGDKWLFFTAVPLKDAKGHIIGAVETLQDITARKKTEEALIKAQQELEKRVEERTALLTLTNADLKTEILRRKKIEAELRRNENKFRAVIDFTYDWEYWINPDGHHIYTSPSCERITGYHPKEFIADSGLLAAITHPDDRIELVRHIATEIKRDRVSHLDFRILTRHGEERWISHSCQPVFSPEGENIGRRASNRDITKRKQLESALRRERQELEVRVKERTDELSSAYANLVKEGEARKRAYEELKKSEEELRNRKEFIETILNNLPIGLAVHTLNDGIVHYMNSEFTHIYDWPKDALGSFDMFFKHVYPDQKYRTVIKRRVLRDISTGDPAKMIWQNLLPTTQHGEQRVVTVRGIPLFEQNLIIITAQDITEKHKSDAALQFTRFSIDHANDMIYWVDPAGKIVDVNDTTCIKLGRTREELLSMSVMDINPGMTFESFRKEWEHIRHQENWRTETSYSCKNGKTIPVETHVNHIGFSGKEYNCVFARDITERRELERLVAIQDKMGSLGRVAAGIAHEIRNPLSTINVYISTLKRLLVDDIFAKADLTNINEAIAEMDTASHKIETVVKRVMDFSKPSQQRMQFLNVNKCIGNAIDLSAVTIRKSGVSLQTRLDASLPDCYLDGQLIEQMVLNLITNAIEELTEREGQRQLLIKTTEKKSKDGKLHIVISVADSGAGVIPELRDKIFDPFFTTKNYGSGIGLSICHRIISDHDGVLRIATSKWGGALFTAEFPVRKGAVTE
jgi:PAS domain S-box-containing protein